MLFTMYVRSIIIYTVLFSSFGKLSGQERSSNLPDNSSSQGFRGETRDEPSARREIPSGGSDEFLGRSSHSLFDPDKDVRSAKTWLGDIQRLSVTTNTSTTRRPHPYILAMWRLMVAEGGSLPKLGPGPQSVVAIRTEQDTDWSETLGMSVLFDLTDVYLDGDTPVTVAQVILYKETSYWEQLDLSAHDHLELRMTVCNGQSVEGLQPSSCIHTYSRRLTRNPYNPEVFNITDATRSLLMLNIPSMQLHLTAWLFSRDMRNQAQPGLFFMFHGDERSPLLILYRNLNPPSLGGELANSRLKRQRRQRKQRNAIEPNSQRNMDCHLHEWHVHFSVMHWSWIIEPKVYQANYCAGNCPSPLADKHYNSTNHAYIKNVYNMETNWQHHEIPRACCVPTHFQNLSMLYREGAADVVKVIPEMIATSCACM